MTNDINILETLINIPSPSGYETQIAEYIKQELSKVLSCKNIVIDDQKNVIVKIIGKTDKTVIIDAHSDEIGFIITNVNRWGQISINYIGGGDSTILSARHLNILSQNGIVPAVVNRKHAHLVYDEDMENIYSPEQADVDIGIRDRDKIFKLIRIGDAVVYRPNFRKLQDNYYCGYGFDDKSGCFLLIETIKNIVKTKIKPDCNLIFVFSSQEETGNSKLIPVVRKYQPNLVIEADVTFATDYGEVDELEMKVGRCNLNEGIVLYRGVDLDENCWELATSIAENKKIPYQVQAGYGRIGYTSLEVTGEAKGVKALVWGIPLRNMHAPTEIINLNDLITGSKLLKHFLLSKKLISII